MSQAAGPIDRRTNGGKVIPGERRDADAAQTPEMSRGAAINLTRVGAPKLWAGMATIHANATTGGRHHGARESVGVVRRRAGMRWGEMLPYIAEAGSRDCNFEPSDVPHQEINAAPNQPFECVVMRSDNEVAVNLAIEPVGRPETVPEVDPIHKDL